MRILILAALSGILIGTSYIPFPPWALVFCFVPLWIQWTRDPRPKSVFFNGWVTQFIFTIIGFHWIAYTTVEFGHMPWPIGIIVLLGFSSFFHLHVPVSGLIWSLVQRRWPMSQRASILFLALTFALLDLLWPMIFPWNIGYSWLWAKVPLYHWADVIGFAGLSTATVLLNVFMFHAWQNRRNFKKSFALVGTVAAVLIVSSVTGNLRNEKWKSTDKKISFLAIQANIGNLEKYWQDKGDQYQEFITDKYIAIARDARKANPEADIMVFPETAIPIDLDLAFSHHFLHQRFTDLIKSGNIPVITGAYSSDPNRPKIVWNGLFLYGPLGNYIDVYRKTILLAFGEYFPGSETFPFLKKLVPAVSDFGRGSEIKVLTVGDLSIGPQICYEGLYADHSRELVKAGAQIFFNATNDSWFGLASEPHQHLYMTLGRAIEFRRPLMRVTNTGITTAILADGTVLEKSPMMQEWYHQYDIPYLERPVPTPFEKWGKFQPLALLLALILTFVWGRRERSKTH
jgi:apolipoprotein N-acyltransferase